MNNKEKLKSECEHQTLVFFFLTLSSAYTLKTPLVDWITKLTRWNAPSLSFKLCKAKTKLTFSYFKHLLLEQWYPPTAGWLNIKRRFYLKLCMCFESFHAEEPGYSVGGGRNRHPSAGADEAHPQTYGTISCLGLD